MDPLDRPRYVFGVVPPQKSHDLAYTPFFQGVLNGLLNEAEDQGYDLTVLVKHDILDAELLCERIRDHSMDGVVFIAPPSESALDLVIEACRSRSVMLSFHRPGSVCITVDNRDGIFRAVDHLVELGHAKIAHIAGRLDQTDGSERLEAFKERMGFHHLEVPIDYIQETQFTTETGFAAAQRLIWAVERPTAIVCANDETAVGAIRAAWENGLRVPGDMSIVGFDNSVLCETSFPTITSVRQPWIEMGARAVRSLVDLIHGEEVESSVFNTELVIRSSTSRVNEEIFHRYGSTE